MSLRNFTHADLIVSPLNVRLNQEDADATEALEASILAHGLLFPLVVHPVEGGKWGVLAGGRRFRAIGKLIGRGDLPTDWEILAVVREAPPAQITELSLSENLLRRELRPYEVHAAVARARAQGATVEDIATNTGQRVEWVKQQLRLGNLAPEIFAAYADHQISADQARAYAATEDQELQLVAWKHLSQRPNWNHQPNNIRAFLKVGDQELERLLRFVGSDEYRAAGGSFELDLFADGPDERGRVTDETLLRKLAEQALDGHRERIRRKTGREDLRFAAAPPENAGTTDWSLKIEPEYRTARKIDLPAGNVIATLTIGNSGDVEVNYWWASRTARRAASAGATKKAAPVVASTGQAVGDGDAFDPNINYSYAQAARAAVKDEHGLTADGLQIIRSLRRMMLRNVLIFDCPPAIARDYLLWSLLRQEFGQLRQQDTGTRPIASDWNSRDDEPRDLVRDFFADELVAKSWETMVAAMMRADFMLEDDPAESLRLYFQSDEQQKEAFTAILAGQVLIRSANAAGWRCGAHDVLVEYAGASDATLRRFWQPSAAFVGLFPKLKRLELAQHFADPDAFRSWSKQGDKVLSGAVAGALEHAQGDWVHPLLSFEARTAEEAAELEAAE